MSMPSSWKCATGLGLVMALPVAGAAAAGSVAPSIPAQLAPVLVADTASALPEGWQHGAFAEIFVRAYRDSDGDGVGDLRGLTQSLDYLHALGVRGLWLMPVTRSGDHDHGYAVGDYRDIEPAYGTLADFDELLRQAHARGIGVIVDYVLNHSASVNPIFVDAAASPASHYRSWYLWRDPAPAGWSIFGKDPWVRTVNGAYLAQFSQTMPDFNLRDAGAMAFHEDNLRFWLNRGVDGFRFDAVTHLVENGPEAWQNQPENLQLMGRVRALVDQYRHRYVVCEAPSNALAYAAPSACAGAFAMEAGPLVVAATTGKRDAIRRLADFFARTPASMAPILSNHDLFAGERLWDQVGGDRARYRLAAASYLLLPGTPFIYYGEEIGLSAAPQLQGDPRLRTPMSWTGEPRSAGFSSATPFRELAGNAALQNVANEMASPDSLLSWYRTLLDLRNRFPSLRRGSYVPMLVEGRILAFRRQWGDESALVVINYGRRDSTRTLHGLRARDRFLSALPAASLPAQVTDARGNLRLRIPAQSVLVLVSR